MSNKNIDFDWHNTQNDSYVDLCRERLDQPMLTWVRQFVNIINSWIDGNNVARSDITVNDFGCNVGHFYRGVVDINCGVSYIGFDISRTYLDIAGSKFGSHLFQFLDFSKETALNTIRSADVAVISATLEHVFDFEQAIANIFSSTRSIVIIRTFVGSESLMEMCRTNGATEDYLIRQFTIDDIVRIPLAAGWAVSRLEDMATKGEFKFVCNSASIYRKQEILVFLKRSG